MKNRKTAKFSVGVVAEENWFRGRKQKELLSITRWDLLTMAIDGPELTPDIHPALDQMSVALCVSDPRIWPLTIARISVNYGKPSIAIGVAVAAMSESRVGPSEYENAANCIQAFEGTATVDAGFLVLGRELDERVELIEQISKPFRGKNWDLYQEICLKTAANPHVSLPCAAFLLDVGFSPRQIFYLVSDAYMIPIYANVIDGHTRGFNPVLDHLSNE